MRSQPSHYAPLAIALHWTLAACLAFQLGLGWHMGHMPQSAAMFDAYQIHKSIGITILLLSLMRVAVRLGVQRPAPVAGPVWQTRLASVVHGALYVFMIGGPLTGWAVVSTAPVAIATLLFHTLPLPHLPLGHGWHAPAETAHWFLAWLGVALIGLHVAGALRHQIGPKAGQVLPRMMPALATKIWLATAVALGGLLAAFALPWAIYQAPAPVTMPPPAPAPVPTPVVAAPSPAADVPQDIPSEAAPVLSADWIIEPGSKLSFSAQVNGSAVAGRFTTWSGRIHYDPDHLDTAKVTITVDVLSATTDEATRDSMLKGPEFFGSSPAHRAVFTASGFRPGAKGHFRTAGMLNVNGMKQPVTLDFVIDVKDDKATASGTTTLDRATIAVGTGQWSGTDQIGASVGVNFALKAHRKP